MKMESRYVGPLSAISFPFFVNYTLPGSQDTQAGWDYSNSYVLDSRMIR